MKLFDKTYLYCVPDEDTKALIGKKVFYGNDVDTVIDNVNNETEYPNLDSRGILDCIHTRSVNAVHPFAVLIGSDLESIDYTFVYYDPYYELKKAHAEGKTIQSKMGNDDWMDAPDPLWVDLPNNYRIKPETTMWYAHACGNSYTVNNIETGAVYSSKDLDEVESWCCKQSYCKACAYYDDKNDKTSCKALGYQPVEAGSYSCRTFLPSLVVGLKKEKSRRVTYREFAKWLAKGKGQALYCDITHTDFKYDLGLDSKTVDEDIRVRRWIDDDWHEPTAEYLGIKD